MFMGFIALVVVFSAVLLRGDLAGLTRLRIRLLWVIVLALLVQVVITDIFPAWPRPLLVALHLATYVAAGFMVWVNRRVAGMVVIGVGGLLNGIAIAVNGGTLPASLAALHAAGIKEAAGEFANSAAMADPKLAWLGDTMTTPAWLPFRNVISIGDLVILVGAVILVHVACRSIPVRWWARLSSRVPSLTS